MFTGSIGGSGVSSEAMASAEQQVLRDNEVEPEPYHNIIADNETTTGLLCKQHSLHGYLVIISKAHAIMWSFLIS